MTFPQHTQKPRAKGGGGLAFQASLGLACAGAVSFSRDILVGRCIFSLCLFQGWALSFSLAISLFVSIDIQSCQPGGSSLFFFFI